MDSRTALRRYHEAYDSSEPLPGLNLVCGRNFGSSECSVSPRKGRRRFKISTSVLLHFRGTAKLEDELLRVGEDSLHSINSFPKAEALFLGSQHCGTFELPTSGYL